MTELGNAAASVALVVLLLTSGCGMLSGPVTFAATPADVTAAAQDDAGYELERAEPMNITREFNVAGQTKEVKAVNYLREYKRSVELGPLGEREVARFVVFSTPEVDVAGQTLNPIGKMSNRDLVMQLQSSYESIQNVERVSNRTVTVLGEEATVTKFGAEAQLEGGQSVDVYVHVAKINHEDDFVVGVAVHPQRIDEQQRVNTLLGGIQHPEGD